jgi:hypothetical protein
MKKERCRKVCEVYYYLSKNERGSVEYMKGR